MRSKTSLPIAYSLSKVPPSLMTRCKKAQQERQRADILAAKLRELGVDPDAIA